jgi:PAS domain S-box-containing protein
MLGQKSRGQLKHLIRGAQALSLIIYSVVGAFSVWSALQLNWSNRWVRHTQEVLEQLQATRLDLAEAMAAVRGYALTGDDGFVIRFRDIRQHLPQRGDELQQLTADNERQQQMLVSLRRLIGHRLAIFEEVLTVRQAGGAGIPPVIARAQQAQEQIDRLFDSMVAEEKRLLSLQQAHASGSAYLAIATVGSLVAASFLLVILGGALIGRAIDRPLAALLTGVKRFAAGRLDYRIPVPPDPEFRQLAQAFNDMAARRQQVEEELRISEERFRLSIESAPIGMALVGLDGRFLRVNRVLCEILGYTADELVQLRFQDVTYPEDLEKDLALAAQLLAGQILRYQLAKRYVRKDGAVIQAMLYGSAVRTIDNQPLHAVAQIEDITERERMRKELQSLREQWMSVIAHDLRQPVSTIKLFAETLARTLAEPAQKTKAQHILVSAERLRRMTADLLDFSCIESRQLEVRPVMTDMGQLVREAVERSAVDAEAPPIHISVQGEIPALRVDPARLEQVLANLLSNARKYRRPETPLRVTMERRGDEVEVAVLNEGEGISRADLERLFTRFHRAQSVRDKGIVGLGLGLYIARGIVEAHGGRIWAESQSGGITAFRFRLPLPRSGHDDRAHVPSEPLERIERVVDRPGLERHPARHHPG